VYLGNLKEETKKYFITLKLRRRADQKPAAAAAARRCQKIGGGGERRMSAAAARRDRRRALLLVHVRPALTFSCTPLHRPFPLKESRSASQFTFLKAAEDVPKKMETRLLFPVF
jgi:hypothetical protein